ncbi:hypothetical protein Sste5346_003246 [Sporothrix stenoceras]|uniref:DUF7735 domain-containing protein n=1 Tax=Sporothrix stenoceras TaxID=5173 RepID=A0ABR3ZDT5_9PEZI
MARMSALLSLALTALPFMVMADTAANTVAATITEAPDATDIAAALSSLLPTAPPTTTEDTVSDIGLSIACQSDLLAAFFLHAAPSGDLASALTSYGSVITSQACGGTPATATEGASAAAACTPDPSLWCDFPKSAPSSVLASYTSYGRAAASFLPSGVAPLVTLASECPQAWYAAATMFPQGPGDLYDLVVLGECFATERNDGSDASPTGTDSGTGAAATATGSGSGSGSGTADKPSGTGKTSGTATGGSASGSAKPTSGAGGMTASNMALPAAVVACLAWAMML